MKRRLFLKNGSLSIAGVAGMAAAPALFTYGCIPRNLCAIPFAKSNPFMAEGLEFFSEGAEFFDLATAELRVVGNGEFSPANSEVYQLTEVVEQIYQQAEVQAEIPIDFAESAQEIMDASSEMLSAAPELTPLPEGGYPELAEDFALLKVLKATATLHSASEVDPHNRQRANVAENMFNAANELYVSLEGNCQAEDSFELIESSEALLAYSEEYVGTCETFAGLAGFKDALDSYGSAEAEFSMSEIGEGAGILFAASESLALSAEYHVEGIYNLNAEAEIFNGTAENQAVELVPFLNELVSESRSFIGLAQGESAEIGASEMLYGAEMMRDTAETNTFDIYAGGEAFELGAEQFLAGTLSFYGSDAYNKAAGEYFEGAEEVVSNPTSTAEQALLVGGADMLYDASESVFVAAEALEFINGEYYVIETPEVIESGPEVFEIFNSVATSGENPDVSNMQRPNHIEIVSPDPVEWIRPRAFEIAGEIFRLPRSPEITAETTETEFVYANAELGTENLTPAATEVLQGAELLEGAEMNILRRNGASFGSIEAIEIMEGSFEMMEGAEYGLEGAIEIVETPEFIQDGGQHIEDGAFELVGGAMEFVEGLAEL